MDAFDADVLIFAAEVGHPIGNRVAALFDATRADPDARVGIGSTALLPEVLVKPARTLGHGEVRSLAWLLSRLDLVPMAEDIADLAVSVGARYALRSIDAIHLATAVHAGADRFITNNRRDVPKSITEIDVTYPSDLPEPD